MMFTTNNFLRQKTTEQVTRFPSYLRQSSAWIGCLLLTIAANPVTLAHVTSNRELPPPPSPKIVTPQPTVNQVPPVLVEVTPAQESATPIKEYTFQAPQTIPAQTINHNSSISESQTPQSQPSQNPNLYRVEVVGDNPSLLSQVKTVEPMAFVRQSEGVIHAGMFQHSQQAEERVRQLQTQGVKATVIPVYQQTQTSLSVQMKP